jgi:hypothetical protein
MNTITKNIIATAVAIASFGAAGASAVNAAASPADPKPPTIAVPSDAVEGNARAVVNVTGCGKYPSGVAMASSLLVGYKVVNGRWAEFSRATTGSNGCATLRATQGATIHLQVYKYFGNCAITSPDGYNGYSAAFRAATSTRNVWSGAFEIC